MKMAVRDSAVAKLAMTPVRGEFGSQRQLSYCCFLKWGGAFALLPLFSESFAVQASAFVAACSLSLANWEWECSVVHVAIGFYRGSESEPKLQITLPKCN